MLKIALLFLFCAISGYGINGLPDEKKVNIHLENETAVTNLNDTNSNGKATSPEMPSTNLSITVPEKTAAELHQNITTSNVASTEKNNGVPTNTEITEDASTKNPMNESKITSDDLNKSVTTFGSLATTKSPATTVPIASLNNDLLETSTASVTTIALPVVPVPSPKAGMWIVNETNQVCIIVNMAVQFNISYTKEINETVSKLFNLPDNVNETVVTGECGKLEQYIRLSFNDTKNVTNNFTLHFVKNESQYSLHHLELILLNPNDTVVLVHDTSLVSGTGINNSYRCWKQQNFTLAQNGTDKVMGYFLISDLHFQAFKTSNNKDFGEVKDCKLDTPDIVPIAVGCALAGLVVIVLIAYLMGRRRSQGRGYLSM